jgi:hypothetical protein
LRQACQKGDLKNLGRIKHSLTAENVVIISCRGDEQTIMEDGQIEAEVLFVWTDNDNPSLYQKFEKMTLHIGYEPRCFCGANCAERLCVHILGFFMQKCGMDSDDPLMYQVALLTRELKLLIDMLMTSNGLQVDMRGNERIKDLIQKEHSMIQKGAETRSSQHGSNRAEEAIGANLKHLQESIKDKQKRQRGKSTKINKIGKKTQGQAVSPAAAILKSVIARGGAGADLAPTMSISPCRVIIESPKSLEQWDAATSGSKRAGSLQPRSLQKRGKREPNLFKSPGNLDEMPLGEARIYRNWSVDRKCFGHKCYAKIGKGEWFVCVPMLNHYAATNYGSGKASRYGFCLKSGGKCLDRVDVSLGRAMKASGTHIAKRLPVHIHGEQSCDADCLEELGRMVPNRPPPYLAMQ